MGGGALRELSAAGIDRRELLAVAMGLLEVMADDLLVLGQAVTGPLLEPVREPLVQLGTGLLEQRAIDGIADEDVVEAVERVGEAGGVVGRADEVAIHQHLQGMVDPLAHPGGRQLRHRRPPELVADHGGSLGGVAGLVRQEIETRREQRLDARRDVEGGEVAGRSPAASLLAEHAILDEHRDDLLHEEGVALSAVDEHRRHGRRQLGVAQQAGDQRGALASVERLDGDDARPRPAVAGERGRGDLGQLRPRQTDDQQRAFAGCAHDVRHELKEARRRPVEIVEHHDDRALPAERRQQRTERPEDLVLRSPVVRQPDRAGQRIRDGPGPGVVAEQARDLRARGGGRVLLGDTGRRPHHLAHRPVGDGVAVGRTAAAQDPRAIGQPQQELLDEPRLPHAGFSQHRDDVARAVRDRLTEPRLQDGELRIAADEPRPRRPGGRRRSGCTATSR